MNATDQQKVLKAGFTIIRRQDGAGQPLVIRYKGNGGHEWSLLEKDFQQRRHSIEE